MITIIVHDKQWFIDRIGKRIYRKENFCPCPICVNIHKEGLIVMDEYHAIYLYDCQSMNISYHDKL
jgi:hypothetical protein